MDKSDIEWQVNMWDGNMNIFEIYDELRDTPIKQIFQDKTPHYIITFAYTMTRLEIDLETTINLLLYNSLRDQISAAIRLGIIGPMDAHAMQVALSKDIKMPQSIPDYREASRNLPLLDIAQANHQHLYAKLFQN